MSELKFINKDESKHLMDFSLNYCLILKLSFNYKFIFFKQKFFDEDMNNTSSMDAHCHTHTYFQP